MLRQFGVVDMETAAALRGEGFVPTPDSLRPRITCVALAPSGLAVAAGDASGAVHVLAPAPLGMLPDGSRGAYVSRFGLACEPGTPFHGAEPWLSPAAQSSPRAMRVDATAGAGAKSMAATLAPAVRAPSTTARPRTPNPPVTAMTFSCMPKSFRVMPALERGASARKRREG